jgi:hypothetical protein
MSRSVTVPPTSCSNHSATSGASKASTGTSMPVNAPSNEVRWAAVKGTAAAWSVMASPPALKTAPAATLIVVSWGQASLSRVRVHTLWLTLVTVVMPGTGAAQVVVETVKSAAPRSPVPAPPDVPVKTASLKVTVMLW